jgi:hypothetical protein
MYLHLLVHLVEAPSWRKGLLTGFLCGICIAIRLNNLLIVAPLLCWVLYRERKTFLWMLAPFVALSASVATYNFLMFHSFSGSYASNFNEPFFLGMAGLLLSPARGLLIYFPLALFAALSVCAFGKHSYSKMNLFYLMLSVAILLSVTLVEKWNIWYGGWCYGPRLLTEIQPLLLLLVIPAWQMICRNRFFQIAFGICLIGSVSVQMIGAFCQNDWNENPLDIDHSQERLWDWSDNPIARAIRAPANYSPFPTIETIQEFLDKRKKNRE